MTDREKAMQWWIFLDDLIKDILTRAYYTQERKFKTLTGREIEIIYNKENELA